MVSKQEILIFGSERCIICKNSAKEHHAVTQKFDKKQESQNLTYTKNPPRAKESEQRSGDRSKDRNKSKEKQSL